MGILADTLGGKVAGELIRANDWNALIAAIEEIDTRLTGEVAALSESVEERFGAVQTDLDGLAARADAAESAIAGLQATVEALRQRFRRVTLNTERVTYAIGELVEITGQLTDLDGAPLDLGDATARPWIDFVSSWGQFRAVPGFTSRGGAGDRTISVQVNAAGEARVRLRADHAERFTAEEESGVAAALTTRPAASELSIAESVLGAATPMEANLNGTFQALSLEYDRTDTRVVQRYVDAYYYQNPTRVTGRFSPVIQPSWRDYRATVLAVAKTDADPRTPDPSLGTCSIQVTFRDWIGPWIVLDYLPRATELVPAYRDRLGPRLDNDVGASVRRVKEEVIEIVRDKGLIAKHRDYNAIGQAVGQIGGDTTPVFFSGLVESVQNGVNLQQTLEFTQASAIGGADPAVGFDVFAEVSTRADTQAAAAIDQVTRTVGEELENARQQIQVLVQQEQAAFKDDLLRADGPIMAVQSAVDGLQVTVQGVQSDLGNKINLTEFEKLIPGIL